MNRGIAIVIESLGGGGAQHVAVTLANAWAVKGVPVTMITMQSPTADKFHVDPHVRRYVIGGVGMSANFIAAIGANISRLQGLRKALSQSDAHTVLSFVGSTNVLAVLASIGLPCRVVVSERNDPARQSLGTVWDLLRRWTYKRASMIIANSRAAIETMKAYAPAERMIWLPNPLREASAEEKEAPEVSRPCFLAVGRLNAQKGYDVLLSAFATAAAALPDWNLILLGDGPLRPDLEAQAAKLNIAGRVHFEGYIADPFPWYRASSVFVHPARFEGLPNSVLEAMSEGLPVIVTDSQTGLQDFVQDGTTGVVVPTDNVHRLAHAMVSLAQDQTRRQRLGDAGRAAVAPCRSDHAVEAWSRALGL